MSVATMASAAPSGDPPGANGTVKIHQSDNNLATENEPHVTCSFTVQFFGFDTNEKGTLVFTAHPPTGDDQVLLDSGQVTISTDAAGGGPNDPDAAFTFSLNDFKLGDISPHPKQGFHVKLTVTTTGGGTKQKVFWVKPCTPPSPSPSPSPSTSPSASPSPSPSVSPSPSPSISPSPSPSISPSASTTAPASSALVPSGAVKAGGGGGSAGALLWGLGALTAATGAGFTLFLARRRRDYA
jgi:hypothetical protein